MADFLRSRHPTALWDQCGTGDTEVRFLIEELEGLRDLLPGADGPELQVVLDDPLRASRVPEVAASIQRLVEESSPRAHWVLISRGVPQLSVARLRAQRSLFELEGSELAFSEQEIAALFNRIYRLEIDPQALKRLHEITRGWVSALVHPAEHLALREPESHPSELERFLRDKRLPSLDECFAREVLDLEAGDIHALTPPVGVLQPVPGSGIAHPGPLRSRSAPRGSGGVLFPERG